MSKGSSRRKLIVDWNPELRLWIRTPEQDGFFELLEPFSETWPPSGSMRNGRSWQRPPSALPTSASASSSTPGRLLSTPVASDGGTDRGSSAGWGLRDETRRLLPTPRTSDTNGAGTHGDGGMDLRTAVSLLPTPAARDWKSGESNLIGTNARPLNEVVVNLLPTPRARDFKGCDPNPRGVDLNEAVRLLPTPTASNPNDGESLESWEARRQRNLAKGINGNGQGTPLSIAVKLLPTPMAGDAKGTRNATAGRKRDNPAVNEGWTLSDVVYAGKLPNPPAPPADAKSPSTTPEDSAPAPAAAPAPTLNSDGPAQLLPTPTTADGERTSSTYGRGNPTLTGAITDPPSAGGNESSDDPPPGPPTLWDG